MNVVIAHTKLFENVSTLPTTFAPAPPINDLTTTNALVDSEDITVELSSPTAMSLADRLKLAMSKSTAKPANPRAPTERIQRHSVSPSVQTFSPINTEEDINSSGMSLADRLSSVTTERMIRIRTSPNPTVVVSRSPIIRPVSAIPTSDSILEETNNGGATGVMSLAERLALSNKAKPSTKPSNRAPPRRRIAPSGGNRLTDQLAEESSATTERFDTTPTRFRFRGNDRSTSQTLPRFEGESEQEGGEERRIPVRTVDEVPRIKFTFPMRNPSSKPIPFRTTAEPPTKDELLLAVTARTISRAPFSSRFVPTTTTEKTVTAKTETTKTTTQTPTTITTVTTTVSPPTTTPQIPVPVSSIVSCPELQCLDGKCIAISQLNDGVIDCSDGSDEQDFGGLVT